MENLASKYRPKDFNEVLGQDIVASVLDKICATEPLTIRNFLLIGPAGCGKALANTARIYTLSDGQVALRPISEISVGDRVYTRHGYCTKVDGVYPQGELEVHRMQLADGAYLDIADNHLNCIYEEVEGTYHYYHDLPTPELLDKFNRGCHLYVENVLKHPLEHLSNYALADEHPEFRDAKYREIVSLESLGKLPCTCIHVKHSDHTFLCEGLIPTHNTTQARIIAHKLNGPDYEPIEIDAASHGGVEDIRQIVAEARSYPIGFSYKVFIIDECHCLSPQAWASLLKVLEEVPAATVFCFATTNPEKIPNTILSRVQTFQLSKISLDLIHQRLIHIINEENAEKTAAGLPLSELITYEDDAVNYIAKLSQGGMRDSITLLDKCLAYSNAVTSENIHKALNLPNYDDYFLLLNYLVKKNNKGIIELINRVYNSGVNYVKWFDGFLSFISNIVKYIYMKDINATMIPSYYQDKISGYGINHAAMCLKLANKLVTLNQELRITQYLQELTIAHLCSVPTKEK